MKERVSLRLWLRMVWYLRGHGGRIALLCGAAMLSGAGAVTLALAVRQVVNAGLAGEDLRPCAASLLALCGAVLALQLWERWYGSRTRDLMVLDLRRRMLEILLSRRFDALAPFHSGELVSRLGEDTAIVCRETAALLPVLSGSAVRLLGALLALAWLNGPLAAVLLGAGAAAGAAAAGLRIPMRKRSLAVRQVESAVRTGIQECLDDRETTKGLRLERALLHREERLLKKALTARDRQRGISLLASGGLGVVSQAGYCAVLIWGVAMTAGGAMSFGTLTAVLLSG